jgi:ribonuclease-3
MEKLQKKLGYTFKNIKYLKQALTHSSVTSDIHTNYERLEFLGDRILGVTIAEMLCDTFPNEPEGALAQRFVRLVCKETVAEIMRSLGAEQFLIVANEEVRNKDNVLCDVGEAIIAAIYRDSGDMATAQAFVRAHWQDHINRKSLPQKDYKTELQEKTASLKLERPVYQVLEKTGEEHNPVFLILATVGTDERLRATAKGHNKKQAEQQAAAQLLTLLEGKHD